MPWNLSCVKRPNSCGDCYKKHPANIAISWEQYRDEQHSRYSNAAMRMNNGLDIKPDEQDSLLTHQRALTEEFPSDMRSVADIPEPGRQEKSFSLISDRQITAPNQFQSNHIEPTQNNAEIATSSNSTENEHETSKPNKIDFDASKSDGVDILQKRFRRRLCRG